MIPSDVDTFDVIYHGHCWACSVDVHMVSRNVTDHPGLHPTEEKTFCPLCAKPISAGWHLAPASGPEDVEAPLPAIAADLADRLRAGGVQASLAKKTARLVETILEEMLAAGPTPT